MPWPSAFTAVCAPLANHDILAIWDLGEHRHDADRALLLAAAGYPSIPWQELVRLPLGCRDCLLIRLRGATLGDRIPIAIQCPECQQRLEFDTSSDELLSSVVEGEHAPRAQIHADIAGWRVVARALDSRDMASMRPGLSRAEARVELIRRAVVDARFNDDSVCATSLPPEVVAELGARLLAEDPAADLHFALNCPDCELAWTAVFDITAYFWRELSALAHSILQDVHAIAGAYGWSEAEILALSAPRRAFYLSRINS